MFGGNSVSLEMSEVMLAILCGLMFHALAIKCGAPRWQALAATGLLICNPCFTFLSFSFMTEIPFLTAMIATHWRSPRRKGRREQWWLWLSAAMAVVGFLIRPFAAMAIAGCVGATLLYDAGLRANFRDRAQWINARLIKMVVPFAGALTICVGLWVWLTVLGPKPWQVQFNENHFRYIFIRTTGELPARRSARAGALSRHRAVAAGAAAVRDAAMAPRRNRRRREFSPPRSS